MAFEIMPLLVAAADADVWSDLWDILLLLSAALLFGTLAERFGQSAIVGYLVAGTLVSPHVLNWVAPETELYSIAELGVALLLFAIGLEFSPRRLQSLGSIVLKTGILQVGVTAAIGIGAALTWRLATSEALIVGMMVVMSSTACVLRLLTDRIELDSQHGRNALGILLLQDVAVVPMMLLAGVMAAGGSWSLIVGKLAVSLALATLLIGLFYGLFNYVVPRLMLLPSWRKNRDLPVLLAVIMATGSAWAAHAVGLSPAFGAFLAGALLAMSPFATQIRADTRPLTTLMITLFFSAIGMYGNPRWLMEHLLLVTSIVVALVVLKSLVITLVARWLGQPWRYAVATGLCLGQVGEFSFVLATIAQGAETPLISEITFNALISATVVTLLLTPYLVAAAVPVGIFVERWLQPDRLESTTATDETEQPSDKPEKGLIVIAGFGPAGQRVAEGLMETHRQQLVAIDLNPNNVAVARRYGLQSMIGDVIHRDVLEHAGIAHAQAVVITMPHHATVRQLIHLVRDLAPDAFIIARCRYHVLHWELLSAGAHEVVDEEDQLGRRLSTEVSRLLRANGAKD